MSDTHPPAIDAIAPDFTVPDASGAPRRLGDLAAERPLVLVFYRGHW
jgi:peroxiredoxin